MYGIVQHTDLNSMNLINYTVKILQKIQGNFLLKGNAFGNLSKKSSKLKGYTPNLSSNLDKIL